MNINDLHIGDLIRFSNGREVTITGLELTEDRRRVRVTRFHQGKGSNVTTWMQWHTFKKKKPTVITAQIELPF